MRAGAPMLLLHGMWHGSWCWTQVGARLAARGQVAAAVDMAGHGLRTAPLRSSTRRPFDAAAFAEEASPVRHVGLDEAAAALRDQIELLGRGEPVAVVAHSMSGPVLTRVAEQSPSLIAHAVYVAAYMPASGVPALAYVQSPENAGEMMSAAIVGDPMAIGAMRLDVRSPDEDYRRNLREALYADVDDSQAEAALALLSPDGPAAIGIENTVLTADGWGSVPRTYVKTTEDRVLRPATQDRMIAEADAAFGERPTKVVELASSHSPFLSMPDELTDAILNLDG